jgi:gliding motility-associated-like protein
MRFCHIGLRALIIGLFMYPGYFSAVAQDCPANIDFESGTFDGWTCYTGFVTGNGINQITLFPSGGPQPERHTMYSSFPGDGVDYYGGFPINCPNGSGHSIRLGNSFGGGEAEGISYEFTIPANQNYYSLIYNYAVVFQDPDHEEYQQPRMEIEIMNVTDGVLIDCSSFTFIPFGNILPGFFQSPNPGADTPVWCKDWTAVSINLNGHAGKTIRLFFKTADCTFRRHFGYAYIDVNSECSGTFVGAAYCPDDTLVNVVAPYGYESYTWFNSSFTQIYGYTQVLTLNPPPPPGTLLAVQLIPYAGYGCPDTLYAQMLDTLQVRSQAGPDDISCNRSPVQIGKPPRPGLVYNWTPVLGLTSPYIANPHATPDTTTEYVLTTNHDGGGCISKDTVVIRASVLDNHMQLLGKQSYCIASGDSAVLRVQPTDSIQWYKDGVAIPGANQPRYQATVTGVYHAMLYTEIGCTMSTTPQTINVSSVPVAGIGSGLLNQCLIGNRFTVNNTSTNAVGAMQYTWDMGDGTILNSKDITHSYLKAGVYDVKMLVSSSPVCRDSSLFRLTVYQNAAADFAANPVCINLPATITNNTLDTMDAIVNYSWDFGNGQVSNIRNPVPPVYTATGTYSISLSVNTSQCPSPISTLKRSILVDKPRAAVTYPVEFALEDYPLNLQARPFGETVFWSPGTFLNTQTSYTPVFNGPREQTYTIEIKTISGCVTVDTQVVKTVKEVGIYVPSAFTPNKDGLNDFLRPVLMGIKEVRYFRIFNRWGQLLFEAKTDRPGWDGTISGIPQGTQVFVWLIEGVGMDDKIYRRKGTSTLVR